MPRRQPGQTTAQFLGAIQIGVTRGRTLRLIAKLFEAIRQ